MWSVGPSPFAHRVKLYMYVKLQLCRFKGLSGHENHFFGFICCCLTCTQEEVWPDRGVEDAPLATLISNIYIYIYMGLWV